MTMPVPLPSSPGIRTEGSFKSFAIRGPGILPPRTIANRCWTAKKQTDLLAMWIESSESILRNKTRYGDRVIILTFEDLVGRTEPTMRRLARELDIEFDPVLLEPTFNGRAIKANSSFAIDQTGIIKAPLSRASKLSPEERGLIEGHCMPLYDSLAGKALTARPDAEGLMKAHHFSKDA